MSKTFAKLFVILLAKLYWLEEKR